MEASRGSDQEFEKELHKLRLENESLKKRLALLKRSSEFDEETQLYSQGYFKRRFTQELRRAERYCEFLSLVLIDTSSALADQGSQEKTKALKSMGELIGSTVRATDILTFLGKNRLALILTATPKEGAFNHLALRVFRYQYTLCKPYQTMCANMDVQVAPIDVAASIPITVSVMLGMNAATRSSLLNPA